MIIYRNKHTSVQGFKAYRNTLFEREAYNNEKDLRYLDNRKRFAWIKYLK